MAEQSIDNIEFVSAADFQIKLDQQAKGAGSSIYNFQQTDAELTERIQYVDLIKYNPNKFFLEFYDFNNHWNVLGQWKTLGYAAVGGFISLNLFLRRYKSLGLVNTYTKAHQGFGRFLFGATIGGAAGWLRFGDRQKLHNAYVSERLRRNYPESMSLDQENLWMYQGTKAPHSFYGFR